MATNIRILHNYLLDASSVTLTNSAADASFPAANALEDRVKKVAQIHDGGDPTDAVAWVKFDFGAETRMTQWAIINHNLTSSATVKLSGSNSGTDPGDDPNTNWILIKNFQQGLAEYVAAVVHIIRADELAGNFLEEIIFFIRAFGRA